ncbi:MAG: TMEM43 family protein [Candidatus Marithrix sp.]
MVTFYTESNSQQSWNIHTKDYFKNVIFGVLLLSFSLIMLFWNEGNVIYRVQTLEEAEQDVISIKANQVDLFNESKLIHLSGPAVTNEIVTDEKFWIDATDVIKLRRIVEMYQWQESQHSESKGLLGSKDIVTMNYTYEKMWLTEHINSKKEFKNPLGHKNPSMPIKSKEFIAEQVTLGEFTLSDGIVNQLNNYQHIPIEKSAVQIQDITDSKISLKFGDYYIGKDPAFNPQIGDLRIRFEIVLPTTITVIAKQADSDLIPYQTRIAGKIELFEYGTVNAKTMFKQAKIFNNNFVWFLRFVGFLLMFIGLGVIFQVFRILATIIPFFNSILGYIGWFGAFIFALTFSLDSIAISWLYYRPLAAIILILISLSFLFLLKGIQSFKKVKEPKVDEVNTASIPMEQRTILIPSEHMLVQEIAIPIK